VTAGNVAGLVREHPDQLVRGLGAHDQAGVDEFILPAGNEGIHLLVFDQIDVQCARLEPGHLPDRGHHCSDIGLDLGVADKVLGSGELADAEARDEDHAL